MIMTGENRKTQRKTCPSATLSITNPTQTDLRNQGLRGEKLATNSLSYGTTYLLNEFFEILHTSKTSVFKYRSPINALRQR
jgi:hypothetical protein